MIFNSLSKKPGPIFRLGKYFLETHYPPISDLYLGYSISDRITTTKLAVRTTISINLKPHFRKKPNPNYLRLLKSKFRRARAGTLLINPETNILQPTISIQLYKSITRSTLLYACEITDFDCDQILSLEVLQSDTLRCMLNLDKRCPKAIVRLVTGIEPLEARFNLHKIMYYLKLSRSENRGLLNMVQKRRKTAFGATPLGFHHTCYNLLKKYRIFSLWDDSTTIPIEDLKIQVKSVIWRHHWEHDLKLAKAYHTPLSNILLTKIRPHTVKELSKPHFLLSSLKALNLPRSTISKALR